MVREVGRRRISNPPRAGRRMARPLRRPPAGAPDSLAPSGPDVALQLLGSFRLRCGSRAVRALPKKAQALLAYLASQQGRAVSREQLADLLWDDSGADQARRSLRQCLMTLRAALKGAGEGALGTDGDTLSLAAGALPSDVDAFERLCASDSVADLEIAAALYRGEFLDGLQIASEPFNEWMLVERRRLASAMSDVLARLAAGLAQAGEGARAIAVAERLTTLDPLREDGHRLLMRLLAIAGRRSSALKQHALCVDVLRRELGVAPEPGTAELAEAIRAGSVGRESPRSPSEAAVENDNAPMARRSGVALALPERPSIALLPFKNMGGDADQDYFADGITEDLALSLGRIPWLFVIASSATGSYRGHAVAPRQVGAELGVRYVLRGSVRKSERRLRVVVQLSDASDERHVWSDRFEGGLDDVFDIQDRVTAQVSALIGPALQSAEIERIRHKPTESLTAYDLYLRAMPRFRSSLADNREAVEMLDRAITIDPSYGAAYGLAARCWQFQKLLGWLSPDDPSLAEGTRLGQLAAEVGQNDSEALWMAGHALSQLAGETEHGLSLVERSLALNPNSANAWISSCALHAYLGNSDIAVEHFKRAHRLNPLDSMHHFGWNLLAMAYFSGSNFLEAERSADKALNASPAYAPALRIKIAACGMLGRIEEGRECVQRLVAVHPGASVAWFNAFWGPPMRRNPRMLANFTEGARRAGLPEDQPLARTSR